MILVHPEPIEEFANARVYEHFHFCNTKTNMWNEQTNQPVCIPCSLVRTQDELPPCVPDYVFKPRPIDPKLQGLLLKLDKASKDSGYAYGRYASSQFPLESEKYKTKYDRLRKRIPKLIQKIHEFIKS